MIHVIATVQLKKGKRPAFLREFRRLVPTVLKEKGCIAYGPTVDLRTGLPRQLPYRADVAVIVEQWRSLKHLKAHLVAPHMTAYRERVKDYVAGAELQILEPA